MNVWEEKKSELKTEEPVFHHLKNELETLPESFSPYRREKERNVREEIERYLASNIRGTWGRISRVRRERFLERLEGHISIPEFEEKKVFTQKQQKKQDQRKSRCLQKQSTARSSERSDRNWIRSAQPDGKMMGKQERRKASRIIQKTAEKITTTLSHPDRMEQGESLRRPAPAYTPEKAGQKMIGSFLASSAALILGFLYSLLAPFIFILVGILLLVALIAVAISAAFTVLSGAIADALSSSETGLHYIGRVPYYCQGDYPDIPFNSGTIASDGCGITSFAMAASGLTGTEITPPDVAETANADGRYNTVTSHGALSNLSAFYAVGSVEEMGGPILNCCGKADFDRAYLIKQVSSYHPVILSMTGGRYNPSGGGHYMLIFGAGENGAYVYDPQSRETYESSISEGGNDWDEIFENAKHIWIFAQVSASLSENSDAARLFHILKEQGNMSDAAAAGIVGNVFQETNHGGEDINIHSEGDFGGGIVGWTDYTYADGSSIRNFTEFKQYAASCMDPWPDTSLETQAAYLIEQLENGTWYWSNHYSAAYGDDCNMSYEAFKQLTDPGLAARTFCAKYEQPAFESSDIEYRVQMAYAVYENFSG